MEIQRKFPISFVCVPFRTKRAKYDDQKPHAVINTGVEFDHIALRKTFNKQIKPTDLQYRDTVVIGPCYNVMRIDRTFARICELVNKARRLDRQLNVVQMQERGKLPEGSGILFIAGSNVDLKIYDNPNYPHFLDAVLRGDYNKVDAQTQLVLDEADDKKIQARFSRCSKNTYEFGTSVTDYVNRVIQEKKLIKQALLTGRPILAVCGGTWVLMRAIMEFIGKSSDEPLLNTCEEHTWEKLPCLNQDGSVGSNLQMHDIEIVENSLLHELVNKKRILLKDGSLPPNMTVNSFHRYCVAEKSVERCVDDSYKPAVGDTNYDPALVHISSRSVQNADVAPQYHKRGQDARQMKPTDNEVESFEMVHGSPVIGVQWHPEAYASEADVNAKLHQHLIRIMAEAGDVYIQKQKILKDIRNFKRK